MSRPDRVRQAAGVGAVLVLSTWGITACSGSGGAPRSSAQPSTVVRSGAPPTLPGAVGAVDDLDGLRCTHDATGVWSARGTLRNDTSTTADYAVSVFVVASKTGTVLGHASRVVRVPGRAAKRVGLERVYAAPAVAGLRCVPHVERARA